jgi:hypothetical protein
MLFTPQIAAMLTVIVLLLFALWLLVRRKPPTSTGTSFSYSGDGAEVEPTEAFGNQPPPGPVRRGARGFWSFLVRWQEFAGWLPLCVALLVLGFIGFSALDRHAGSDLLPAAAALPLKIAYAIAACGIALLFRRRWRYKLEPIEQSRLWDRLTGGMTGSTNAGAIVVHVTDAVLSLCALYWLLRFFSLPS